MPESAEIVVIGGGIVGVCTALELCRAGAKDVVVLDRGEPGAATTQAGAGFLDLWATTQAGAEQEVTVEEYSADFYAELGAQHDIDYVQRGNLWLALSEKAWEKKLRPLLEHPATSGAERLTPKEAAEICAVVEAQGLFTAVYQPRAAHISTAAAAKAVVKEIETSGGRFVGNREVTGIEVVGERIAGVTTSAGRIRTNAVVVAAGAWTNAVLESVGVWVPMVSLAATRFLTEPASIPVDMPGVLAPEMSDLYVREYGGALSWGCLYESSPRYDFSSGSPSALDGPSPSGEAEMLSIAGQLGETIPLLGVLPRVATFTGFPAHTPDYRAVIGPVTGVEGLWLAAGDNYAGVTHGPGFGRLLADRIMERSSIADVEPFSLDRFAKGLYSSSADVLAAPLVQSAGWE
ncbi:MAG: FAD-binding oxidoreductase [Actinobacteria bacterium]|nr:FAD-binding oxidoreductase [Actinomycetota bacterium]